MAQRRLWWSLFLLVALATGCGQQVEDEAPPVAPPPEEPPPERLGDRIDVSLADLLARPRAELAGLADEWAGRAQMQEQFRRERGAEFALLPDARFPLVVPVLREAHFAPAAGLSLPAYVAEGTTDNDLARHLARYGDDEAARQLADPADAPTRAALDACRYDRSYPVEWTRLAGLMLHVAQTRLAQGEPDAATELVVLHRQLREILDPKAAHGPLGTALLPPGRLTLARAAAVWRGSKRSLLAEDVEAALAEWGEAPAPTVAVRSGAGRADVARLLRSPGQGHVIPALATARGLDLFDLPLPLEGAQAVLALFDAADRLSEVLVTYRPGVAALYPAPRELANYFEQRGVAGKDGQSPGLLTRTYTLGDCPCEVVVVSRGNPVGAFVQIGRGPSGAGTLPRDFGAAHLDRGFEQNRVRLAPEEGGAIAKTERPTVLAQVKSLLRRAKIDRVTVERAGDRDATARVRLRLSGDTGATLHEMALRLWAECGPARIEGQEDDSGGHLVLVWEDGRTRFTVRWPYATGEAVELDAEDMTGSDPARRATAAAAFDREERKARLAAGTPLTRLPRHLDYEGVLLGASQAGAQQGLPRGESVVKQPVPGGMLVTFTGEAPPGASHVARQTLLRFGTDGRLIELRTRYGEGTTGGNWTQALVNGLKRRYGAGAELPAPWAQAWADLPARKPAAALYRWQDDLTVLTCQRDAGGVELTLCDASGADTGAEPLPAPAYLPRGPAELSLGASRADVLRAAGARPQTLTDGAIVVVTQMPALYDTLLVYLDGDRVTRLVGRYAQAAPPRASAAQLTKLLTEAWGRDARSFGWPARQDVTAGRGLQGLGWLDGETRVRLFWQESENGPPRLYEEWKELTTK